jgi:phosphatidate phosphatase APP1
MMLSMLKNVMRASSEDFESEVFESRIQQFMAAACTKYPLTINIGGRNHPLRKRTRRNGKFADSILVNSADINVDPSSIEKVAKVPFSILSGLDDVAVAKGDVFLYPKHGLSIVSDIDDTIKISQVGDRRELLANTFLREFRAVEGMPELYQEWQQQGAAFHYVSSSPWQLFTALHSFSDQTGFPGGTFHLRNFRLRDQLLRKMVLRRNGKAIAIRKLLTQMPGRRFILIGDSGEKDPKIYHKICKQFPGRIEAVFIRDVEYRRFENERRLKLERSLPNGICEGFLDAEALRATAAPLLEKV